MGAPPSSLYSICLKEIISNASAEAISRSLHCCERHKTTGFFEDKCSNCWLERQMLFKKGWVSFELLNLNLLVKCFDLSLGRYSNEFLRVFKVCASNFRILTRLRVAICEGYRLGARLLSNFQLQFATEKSPDSSYFHDSPTFLVTRSRLEANSLCSWEGYYRF